MQVCCYKLWAAGSQVTLLQQSGIKRCAGALACTKNKYKVWVEGSMLPTSKRIHKAILYHIPWCILAFLVCSTHNMLLDSCWSSRFWNIYIYIYIYLLQPLSQNPINLKINLFVKKCEKCKTKKQPKKNKSKCKKSKKTHTKKQKKTRIRLDFKLVKYYYNYYSYNCNPFWISRQS